MMMMFGAQKMMMLQGAMGGGQSGGNGQSPGQPEPRNDQETRESLAAQARPQVGRF